MFVRLALKVAMQNDGNFQDVILLLNAGGFSFNRRGS